MAPKLSTDQDQLRRVMLEVLGELGETGRSGNDLYRALEKGEEGSGNSIKDFIIATGLFSPGIVGKLRSLDKDARRSVGKQFLVIKNTYGDVEECKGKWEGVFHHKCSYFGILTAPLIWDYASEQLIFPTQGYAKEYSSADLSGLATLERARQTVNPGKWERQEGQLEMRAECLSGLGISVNPSFHRGRESGLRDQLDTLETYFDSRAGAHFCDKEKRDLNYIGALRALGLPVPQNFQEAHVQAIKSAREEAILGIERVYGQVRKLEAKEQYIRGLGKKGEPMLLQGTLVEDEDDATIVAMPFVQQLEQDRDGLKSELEAAAILGAHEMQEPVSLRTGIYIHPAEYLSALYAQFEIKSL